MDTHTRRASAASVAADDPAGSVFENDGPDLEEAVAVFMAHRPQLVAIAHRVLGSAGDAEDVVQEAWVRWQRTDRRAVRNPAGFLATATSRLAINVLQSARTRHETAASGWVEDVADPGSGTESSAERSEAVEMALHVLLERLTSAERAAFVLRKGFDYPYSTVAALLRLSEPNARQLVSRARARIRADVRRPVGLEGRRRLVHAFAAAARAGEFAELEMLLAADVEPVAA
jgi:RNA polymerase sigma-70 factor (ECF subfamily)